jgi:hypothetical protein
MVAERRRRRPQVTVRRPAGGGVIVVAQMSGCLPRLGRPVRLLGQRPRVRCPLSAVRCPVDGVRCPVSGVSGQCPCPRCPRRPVSNVRVWTSGVPRRCPHVPRPRYPHQVTSWSASCRGQPHTARRGPGLAVLPYRERLAHLPEPEWPSSLDCLTSHRRVVQAGCGDYPAWSSREAQGRVAWSLGALPAGLRPALAAAARPRAAVSAARSTLAAL